MMRAETARNETFVWIEKNNKDLLINITSQIEERCHNGHFNIEIPYPGSSISTYLKTLGYEVSDQLFQKNGVKFTTIFWL